MKRISTVSLAVVMFLTAGARTITPEEALARLAESDDVPAKLPSREIRGAVLAHTALTIEGSPAVYVFNKTASRGYLVLSADDCATPLLGYSDSGAFDEADMPEAFKWWLSEYAAQIKFMSERKIDISALSTAREERQPIEPLVKTMWDQGAPYNDQCPKDGSQATYTGCVATAMAQVMNYFQYPECGTGSISYNAETIQKRLSLNFTRKPFDWDNMADTYVSGNYTQEQVDAVAYLMKACGYAVKMDYGSDSSGALALNIAKGLVTYLGYDPNLTYNLRQDYSASEWEEMIYDNLKNIGPVIYGGGSLIGGGHSFVCDGYDTDGYFHFNWGWTGMSNGYFLLDALNPYSLGAGGGGGGGYNFTQDAVLGMQPPTGLPAEERYMNLTQTGSFAGYVNNDSLKFDLFAQVDAMWVNYNPETLVRAFGATFEPTGDTTGETLTLPMAKRRFSLASGYGTAPAYFNGGVKISDLSSLADGTYKVTAVNADAGSSDFDESDLDWHPIKACYGYFNYFNITKKGDQIDVLNESVDRLQVLDGGVVGDLYYGCSAKISVTVGNGSDREISQGFAPAIVYDGALVMLGESVFITVPPNEVVTREWTTSIYSLSQYFAVDTDTDVQFTFFDESTYNDFSADIYKTLTMHPNPGMPDMTTVGRISIEGAKWTTEIINDAIYTIYKVSDPTDIKVSSTIMLNSGVCAYDIYGCIAAPSAENPGYMAIDSYAGEPVFMSQPGETYKFSTTLSQPNAEPGVIYSILMAYGYGSNLQVIGPAVTYFRVNTTGVEDIAAGDDPRLVFDGKTVSAAGHAIEVYDLRGLLVACGDDMVDVSALDAGVYVARAGGSSIRIALTR